MKKSATEFILAVVFLTILTTLLCVFAYFTDRSFDNVAIKFLLAAFCIHIAKGRD